MYRVTVLFTGATVTGGGIARHYFDEAGGTAQGATTAVGNFWNALRPQMSGGVTWTTQPVVDVLNASTGDLTGQIAVTGATFAGTNGSAEVAKATQGLISWRTGAFPNKREVRGRTYVPGCTSGAVTAGSAAAAYTAALLTAANALIADSASTLLVWSRRNLISYPVVTASSGTKLAVLRSRRD